MREDTARVCAKIDEAAILWNARLLHGCLSSETKLLAVVKADGYGHGASHVAEAIDKEPYLWGYGVATYEEAASLRASGFSKPVLILGYTFPYCYRDLARQKIRTALFRGDTAMELSVAGEETGTPVRVHIAVDTGMSRIGITPDAAGLSFVEKCLSLPGLFVEGLFTHFARADEADKATAREQYRRFAAFAERVREETGYRVPICHAANSAAILELPEYGMDMARAGIALYGLWPSPETKRTLPLRPALSLHSRVVYVKEVGAGVPVSYGGTYVTGSPSRIATIPVGYGDGYPRSLSGCGFAFYCYHNSFPVWQDKCPVVD